jgi:hypothetical protein
MSCDLAIVLEQRVIRARIGGSAIAQCRTRLQLSERRVGQVSLMSWRKAHQLRPGMEAVAVQLET